MSRKSFTKFGFTCGAMGALLLSAAFASNAAAQQYAGQTIRIGSYGGGTGAAYSKATDDAFKKRTGANTVWSEGAALDWIAQLTAAKGGTPPYDIVFIESPIVPQMVEQGLLVKPDMSKIPNAKLLADGAVLPDGSGIAYCYYRMGVGYLPDKLKAAGIPEPKDLSVIFDPKAAGHVTIPDVSQTNWTYVMPTLAAFFGNSLDNPKPTLDKVATIKNIVLYTSSSDLEARMTSGEIWAAVWIDGRINGLKVKGVPIVFGSEGIPNPKGGTFTYTSILGVVEITNPAKKALAEEWLDTFLSTPVSTQIALATTYTPTNKESQKEAAKDPKVGQFIDTDTSKYFQVDPVAWTKVQDKWIDQWGKSMRR